MAHHEHYLTVALNDKGREEYDCGVESSENMISFDLPMDEFEIIYPDVIDEINTTVGTLIEEYESDVIFNNKLSLIDKIIEKLQVPTFKRLVDKAKEVGSDLYFDW